MTETLDMLIVGGGEAEWGDADDGEIGCGILADQASREAAAVWSGGAECLH